MGLGWLAATQAQSVMSPGGWRRKGRSPLLKNPGVAVVQTLHLFHYTTLMNTYIQLHFYTHTRVLHTQEKIIIIIGIPINLRVQNWETQRQLTAAQMNFLKESETSPRLSDLSPLAAEPLGKPKAVNRWHPKSQGGHGGV